MAVAHAVLHLTLCSAMMHAPAGTPLDVKMHATDHTGRQQYDRTFTFARGDSEEQTVEFDSPRGVFFLSMTAPKYNCNAAGFQVFIEDESRNMRVTLTPGKPQVRQPTLLVGTAPPRFSTNSRRSSYSTRASTAENRSIRRSMQISKANTIPDRFTYGSIRRRILCAAAPLHSHLKSRVQPATINTCG